MQVAFWAWKRNIELILIATSYLIWGLLTIILTYIILRVCTNARENAYKSAIIVHRILQRKPIFMLNDDTYFNKMKSFTLQTLHRKNIFTFNGFGLFTLDYTFIFSVSEILFVSSIHTLVFFCKINNGCDKQVKDTLFSVSFIIFFRQ